MEKKKPVGCFIAEQLIRAVGLLFAIEAFRMVNSGDVGHALIDMGEVIACWCLFGADTLAFIWAHRNRTISEIVNAEVQGRPPPVPLYIYITFLACFLSGLAIILFAG